MANHSGILAWEIPWTEQPGGLKPRGCKRVRHNVMTNNNKGETMAKYKSGSHSRMSE